MGFQGVVGSRVVAERTASPFPYSSIFFTFADEGNLTGRSFATKSFRMLELAGS